MPTHLTSKRFCGTKTSPNCRDGPYTSCSSTITLYLLGPQLHYCCVSHKLFTSTTALTKFTSSYQAIHNKTPDYTSLKTFGCACFPHLRPYNQYKLQFRSQECIYLDVSPQHKGHKCLDPSGWIYVSKDVLFNEFWFPYRELFPSKTEISSSSTTPLYSASIPLVYSSSPRNVVLTPIESNSASTPTPSPQNVSIPSVSSESSHSSPENSHTQAKPEQVISESVSNSHSTPPPPPAPAVTNQHPMVTR